MKVGHIGFPGAEVTGSGEPCNTDSGKQTQVPWKSNKWSLLMDLLFRPHTENFKLS